MKVYRLLPMMVFLAFLGVMTALLLFGPHRDFSVNEKRVLSGAPAFDTAKILSGESQKELETFASDQIPFRDFYVGVNAYLNLATGRNGAQDIYFSRDDYLINAPKPLDRKRLTDNLSRFDDFAAGTGLPTDLLMVPSTGYLMAGKLPVFHGTYHDDEIYRIAKDTVRHLRVLDPRMALKTAARYEAVCYHTDHHLTAFGNYILNRFYQAANGEESMERADYAITSYEGFFGTTWSGSGYWLTPGDAIETWESGARVADTVSSESSSPSCSSASMRSGAASAAGAALTKDTLPRVATESTPMRTSRERLRNALHAFRSKRRNVAGRPKFLFCFI